MNELQCFEQIYYIISNITTFIISKNISGLNLPASIIQNTAKDLNQLGLYDQCNKDPFSKYSLINIMSNDVRLLYLGFCGPNICDVSHYNTLTPLINPSLSQYFSQITGANVTVNAVFNSPSNPSMDGAGGAILMICIIIMGFVFIGTLIDLYGRTLIKSKKNLNLIDEEKQENEKTLIEKEDLIELKTEQSKNNIIKNKDLEQKESWLVCFSLIKNLEKLVTVNDNNRDKNLVCFDGVRFISMCWVLLGHEYIVRIGYLYNANDLKDFAKTPGFINFVQSGLYAVDVFFFIGGFFAAFVLIPRLSKSKLNIGMLGKIYFHRWFRLWPSYAITLLIFWKLSIFFGNGPLWSDYIKVAEFCDDKWWTNLLYIDNLFGRQNNYCFAWGWYLSNDFQIFLITPLVLFLYVKNKKYGNLGLLILLLLSLFSSFLTVYFNNFKELVGVAANPSNNEFFNWYYTKPWIRGDVYILGMLFYCFYNYYHQENQCLYIKKLFKSSFIPNIICYIIGLTITTGLIFSVVPIQKSGDVSSWSDTEHVFYLVFNRITFVVGVVLILLPGILTGNDLISSILGCKFFAIVARLAYCFYLVHLIVVMRGTMSTRTTFYASNERFIYLSISDLIFTMVGALAVSMAIEAPLLNLEKKLGWKS